MAGPAPSTITFAQARPLWEQTYQPRFWIDEGIWQQNLQNHSAVVATHLADGAFSVVKRPVPEYGGDSTRFHLAAIAFESVASGVAVAMAAEREAQELGAQTLAFGQDGDHIWPGVPEEHPHLTEVLEAAGFTLGGTVVDLQRNLADYHPRDSAANSPEFRPAMPCDETALFQYFMREFPGRWRVDVMEQFRENPSRVMVWEIDGTIEGHALIQTSDTHHPIGGAIWRNDLGPNWGALGSIGIAAGRRGNGSGGRLLDASLMELRNRKVAECIIDWTGIGPFYEKYGFAVTRKYHSASLTLASS